ncbi:hypothetical protein HDV02_001171 [Globomyces sp. JEL0801]|nr:hypothetical protein HDV02_001171 [Globomyces sp. JEL0801]
MNEEKPAKIYLPLLDVSSKSLIVQGNLSTGPFEIFTQYGCKMDRHAARKNKMLKGKRKRVTPSHTQHKHYCNAVNGGECRCELLNLSAPKSTLVRVECTKEHIESQLKFALLAKESGAQEVQKDQDPLERALTLTFPTLKTRWNHEVGDTTLIKQYPAKIQYVMAINRSKPLLVKHVKEVEMTPEKWEEMNMLFETNGFMTSPPKLDDGLELVKEEPVGNAQLVVISLDKDTIIVEDPTHKHSTIKINEEFFKDIEADIELLSLEPVQEMLKKTRNLAFRKPKYFGIEGIETKSQKPFKPVLPPLKEKNPKVLDKAIVNRMLFGHYNGRTEYPSQNVYKDMKTRYRVEKSTKYTLTAEEEPEVYEPPYVVSQFEEEGSQYI